jgi:hypothetical protein
MSGETWKSRSLSEEIVAAAQICRELREHLDLAFVPKAHDLRRVTRTTEDAHTSDRAVRSRAADVLDADRFARKLITQLEHCCDRILHENERMLGETE